jgi:Tol biopolymer transport system component
MSIRHAMVIVVAWVLMAGAFAPGRADASYPGHNGALIYQLEGYWGAGNLGSCQPCSGGLSGIFALSPTIRRGGLSACIYAQRAQQRCLSGRSLVQCLWSDGSTTPACSLFHPSFSSDGRGLAYARTADVDCSAGDNVFGCDPPTGGQRIVIADRSGATESELPALTADDQTPAFLPGGATLVFAGTPGRSPGAPQPPTNLYQVSTSGTGLQQVTFSGGSQPAPCQNGNVAFVRDGQIALLSPTGGIRVLTRAGGQRPDCAPDGRTVAFVRRGRLWTISTRSARSTAIIGLPYALSGPVFSPDGTALAFTFARTHPACSDTSDTATEYLQIVSITGWRLARPRPIGDDGVDDGDCGGHGATPGAIAWQPVPR